MGDVVHIHNGILSAMSKGDMAPSATTRWTLRTGCKVLFLRESEDPSDVSHETHEHKQQVGLPREGGGSRRGS